MAAIIQNGLMIQQLQLMVVLRQKGIEKEERGRERRCQEEEKAKMEEEKQNKLKEEEIRTMRTWSEEESQRYVEKFRGYRRDTRCRKCGWFGHRAHHCRRTEIEAERELREGLYKNRWKSLECRVMRYDKEREAVCSIRRKAQQEARCWGCREIGHRLWTCPTKVARPQQREAQQARKVVCRTCKGENHVARNYDTYWRWREQSLKEEVKKLRKQKIEELTKKVKELKVMKEKA